MPEWIKCGEDTKFDGGLCYSCYKKGGKSKDVKVAEAWLDGATNEVISEDDEFENFPIW